ncbi:MAG: NirD/YgiW/YdeI family stress tolerance protein [Candidatus Accumulibacter sp.]|jgi:uncharacterized protein (TIGR00156 family)|nr:NirD/YgiW/YdeI family stress tolerance protein [Accumulibacter sp.]
MKLRLFFAIFALLAALPACAQGGFVDNSGTRTVEEAKKLRDHSPVQLQGNIVRKLDDHKYMLRDTSGEIVVKIEDQVWRDVTVGPDDRVEIRGEVDNDSLIFPVKIKVGAIKKL